MKKVNLVNNGNPNKHISFLRNFCIVFFSFFQSISFGYKNNKTVINVHILLFFTDFIMNTIKWF